MQPAAIRIQGTDEIIIPADSPVQPLAAHLLDQSPKERLRTLKDALREAKQPNRLEQGLLAIGAPQGRALAERRKAIRWVAPMLIAQLARGATIQAL